MQASGSTFKTRAPRIAIIGAGIIGLSCAVEMAARGASVSIYDKGDPGRGASWAAAGMLAPAYEAVGGAGVHPRLFELCFQGAALWPDFVTRLERACGSELGYQPGPSLAVATTQAEMQRLQVIGARLTEHAVSHEYLSAQDARLAEPCLGADVRVALRLPSDGHVDNRRVVSGLLAACEISPRITMRSHTMVHAIADIAGDYDSVLCTAGWQSAALLEQAASVAPVGGQLLSVARLADAPRSTIRCGSLYIAPKADRVVIGATVEPGTVREAAQAETVASLKADAAVIVPALAEAPIVDSWAGVRPATPDHAPLLGQVADQPVFTATGHYRNGILLAPITAQIMAEMMLAGRVSDLAAAFSADRLIDVRA